MQILMPKSPELTLDALSIEFFKEFARTEYALKAAGWLRTGPKRDAHPDWDRFAREVGERLIKVLEEGGGEAVTYLTQNPPKKQIVDDDGLAWEQSELADHPEGQRLLIFLRRIRNNLFHGGKFNGKCFSRNAALNSSSMVW
jgi:hypothetical protein